jgi:hypothetical protein
MAAGAGRVPVPSTVNRFRLEDLDGVLECAPHVSSPHQVRKKVVMEKKVVMHRMLIWLVRWPWVIGVAVFCALSQAPLGPWYISAMFVIGAALVAMSLARRLKLKMAGTEAQRLEMLPVLILAPVEARGRR